MAIDDILALAMRVDVRKALNPLDDNDFLVIVGRLTRSLINATAGEEAKSLDRAIAMLDVNWTAMTGTDRDRVIEAARLAVGKTGAKLIKPVTQVLTVVGPRVVKASRRGTRKQVPAKFKTKIGIDMTLRDKRITKNLIASQALFIRDEWGRRSATFSALAREIVGEGVDQGLGRDAIAQALETRLSAAVGLKKSKNYWGVISGVFTNRSRTWGQLASYQDAGIQTFIFTAVMDEATTDQCRALNGRSFEVANAVKRYEEVEQAPDPEMVKDIMPWIRVGSDGQGGKIMFTQTRDGRRTIVGEVVRSGVGKKDDPGRFRGMFTSKQLEAIGAFMPPLHGRCRSTIEPGGL